MNEIPQLTVHIGDTLRKRVMVRATGELLYEEIGQVIGFPKHIGKSHSIEIVVTEHEFFIGCHSDCADGHVTVRKTKDGLVGTFPSVIIFDEFEHHVSQLIKGEAGEVELLRLTD